MAFTDKFRNQHEEMIELIKEISRYLSPSIISHDAKHVHSLLAKMGGKLMIHRTTEGEYLYPRLLNHESDDLKALAHQYYEGYLKSKNFFSDYYNNWSVISKIEENAEEFIEQTNKVFNSSLSRIQKENSELFALADKLID